MKIIAIMQQLSTQINLVVVLASYYLIASLYPTSLIETEYTGQN